MHLRLRPQTTPSESHGPFSQWPGILSVMESDMLVMLRHTSSTMRPTFSNMSLPDVRNQQHSNRQGPSPKKHSSQTQRTTWATKPMYGRIYLRLAAGIHFQTQIWGMPFESRAFNARNLYCFGMRILRQWRSGFQQRSLHLQAPSAAYCGTAACPRRLRRHLRGTSKVADRCHCE